MLATRREDESMEQARIDKLEKDYRVLLQRFDRLDQLERSSDFTIRDMAHKVTITQGLVIQALSEISDFKSDTQDNFSRLNDRVTEAHNSITELEIKVASIEKKQDEHTELLKQILAKLS
jgi:hypothetical protein